MPDYYAVLDRKIQEANSDPAKVREVVYEAARLALRSPLHEQWPHLSIFESKRHLIELEDAIARMEANATSGSRRPQQATTRPPSEQNSITLDQGEAGAADRCDLTVPSRRRRPQPRWLVWKPLRQF
jgi:hypothetical protein